MALHDLWQTQRAKTIMFPKMCHVWGMVFFAIRCLKTTSDEFMQTGNGMTAVGAMYVRNPHRMTPDSRPVDTYPDGIRCTTMDSEKSGMKIFTYSVREHVFVKHLFTCNRSHAQRDANQFFVDLQTQIPLTWQQAQTALASGM